MQKEIDELKAKKKGEPAAIPIFKRSPFSEDILGVKIPRNLKNINITKFSGKGARGTTPSQHLKMLQSIVASTTSDDRVLYRVFPDT